ncbi:bluetail domain-containing putative surface protein [Thermoleptolyngbya sp. C42_A2020_037]|uniref:bluetail domain-containing putative surface protein n=1 Tax=Thermoleptolyngbya sp. C42_A2020_037 TaxID=2747799 RepID=UPI001A0E8C16|nr:bluetail domain-containing putative surface protein [Thermoleptolyngbya sp. C42_A2020_037]MBF2083542.1 calcium-binding protein [Thermoleptolyngbya sp. C42_A2020_037]
MSTIITVTTTADSGAGSLRAAIAQATSGSTIRFASSLAGQTITLTSGQINIPAGKNLTIDGSTAPGLKISGNNKSRIFNLQSTSVQPTSLSVKNLTLTNGFTTERGGAIATEHQGRLMLENVVFTNNVANKGGGAVFSAFEGSLTVTGSKFTGNKATAGNDERGAGAIAFWGPGPLTVKNSEFVNNQGINGGAINSLNGKLTIENSKFLNNSTTAAFYDTGKPNPFLRGFGGAIYTDRASSTSEASGFIRIVNSVFEGNKGKGEGGAAYLYTGKQDSVTITGSLFKDNAVTALPQGNGGNGGAIVVMSNDLNRGLTISNTAFVGNSATGQGGGIWTMKAPATITNSTFSGNSVTGRGSSNVGGGMALYNNATIVNTTIALNTAGWVGGGVSVAGGNTATLKNTVFFNNTAANGGNTWNIQQQSSGTFSNGGGNLQFSTFAGGANSSNLVFSGIRIADPKLGGLQQMSEGFLLFHPLLEGSAAINAGVSSGAPTTDKLGRTRDSKIDIGAVEFGATGTPLDPPTEITGTAANDILLGTAGTDVLRGEGGSDILLGRTGGDTLVGGTGADWFVYSAGRQGKAFKQSRITAPDRILDFNVLEGDRLVFDFDNSLTTLNRPKALFNAGSLKAKTLEDAVKLAYADKNQQRGGRQALRANEAVMFRWKRELYLAANNGTASFSAKDDLVVNLTTATLAEGHATLGALPVATYFA